MTIRNFRESIEDAIKASWFAMSRHHWRSIKEEVRSWVESNWSRWEEEKPKWLDESMKAKIPVEWIPTKEARIEEKERRKSVGKQSVIQIMMGIVVAIFFDDLWIAANIGNK